jgi:hypothetical protein
MQNVKSISLFIASCVLAATPAFAQTTPAPSPLATAAASPAPTTAPVATNAPVQTNPGKHLGQVKKLRAGTLTNAQVRYALTHAAQEAAQLRKIHTVKFDNLRVYRAPSGLLKQLHASASIVAYVPMRLSDAVAQTSGFDSFLNIFANINVQDALNNTLNNNNVTLNLTDVLNGNKIAIGQVVGVYVNSGGVITTII